MNADKPIVIAIDGPSGSGKSTAAKSTAKSLGFVHVDTGAMYRIVTWAVLKRGIDPEDKQAIVELLPKLKLEPLVKDGSVEWWIEGKHPEKEIRSPEVTAAVSPVSAIPEVREWCVAKQRQTTQLGNIVMEGRDIGTVVFPETPHKFFLTASAEVRAQRRQQDLEKLQYKQSVDEVVRAIVERDRKDSSRAHSPLKMAKGAHLIDTSHNTVKQTADEILNVLRRQLPSLKF